jgi:hypothetical protein
MEQKVMVGCTASIIVTMLGCTWWLERRIESAMPSYPVYNDTLVDIHRTLGGIDSSLRSVDSNTESIDRRLMSPEERFREIQRKTGH